MSSVRRTRNRQHVRLREDAVSLLGAWIPQAVGQQHAAAANCSRRTLNRVKSKQWVDRTTASKVARHLGKNVRDLFESAEDASSAVIRALIKPIGTLAETVATFSEFDSVDTSASMLRSQALSDREEFFQCLLLMGPAVAVLEKSDRSSHAQVVAHYYLSLADQTQISNDAELVSFAPTFIERAVTASKRTHDFALQVTCLLHRASFHYSAGRYREASEDRISAERLITRIRDKTKKSALSTPVGRVTVVASV
ncbi:MAG: hypothetical protein KatS3mg104_1537 [Phycisphaerae bacterium]|nr:MAG: hypothetical protein KatS3mg104_1537 [Phycisphaerae bacterium]